MLMVWIFQDHLWLQVLRKICSLNSLCMDIMCSVFRALQENHKIISKTLQIWIIQFSKIVIKINFAYIIE